MYRFILAMFSIVIVVLGSGTVPAQDYPNKPIRIVTAAAGGGGDFTTRIVAKGVSDGVGWPIVVENRAGGLLAIETVAKAPPDGYILLVDSLGFLIGPLLQKTFYDPVTDFTPVALATSSPNILVVHPSLGVKSVKELIALAKARPGQLNYGSTGGGGISQLTGELFKSMAGVNIVHVPYKAAAQALTDVISGQVQLMFAATGPAVAHIESGRLRALAVTSGRPSALLPGLPTVAASGLPGYEAASMFGIFAPAKTPEPIVRRLNQEIVRALNRPDVKDRFLSAGIETVGGSPEEFAGKIKSEIAKWDKVIKEASIKVD